MPQGSPLQGGDWSAVRDRTCLILGFSPRTGFSAAKVLSSKGVPYRVSDSKARADLLPLWEKLPEPRPVLLAGPPTFDQLEGVDWILLSPGVPRSIPLLREAARRGLPIWNDVDFVAPLIRHPLIGITGTDGKSTVVHLLEHLFAEEGSLACGNNGVPVFDVLDRLETVKHPVLELSSYMLEDLKALSPKAAAITNVAPDHLDRYPDFEAYGEAKFQLARYMGADSTWVRNLDNPVTRNFLPEGPRIVSVSTRERADFVLEDGVFRLQGAKLAFSDCLLAGLHHAENILVAAACAASLGFPVGRIAERVATFPGLPHRCRRVETRRRLRVYDDSKATTVQAVEKAVAGLEGPIVLILGGRSKGLDFSSLLGLGGKIRTVIAYGEARDEIARMVDGLPLRKIGPFDEAIRTAWEASEDGDALLLSPGCTSWDQHRDYAERGERFSRIVALLDGGGS